MANTERYSYIYNNESNKFWFKLKANLGQLFKREKNKNSEMRAAVRGELEFLKSDYNLYNMDKEDFCQKVFGDFNTIRLVHGKDISSLSDISKLGDALTSESNSDRKKKNGFYKLISDPLKQLKAMDVDSEEYKDKRAEIVGNIEKYLKKHNPSSKVGKARCEFAERLKFLLNEEAQIEADKELGIEDNRRMSDDESSIDEGELNIENDNIPNKEVKNKEKTSFNNLFEKSEIKLVRSKTISREKQVPILSL